MVQFPRYRFRRLCIHPRMNAIQDVRVTPFGHPRISGCLLLPVAFRSLPRPSSPDSSKASPANSSSLDHITPTSSIQRSIKLGISNVTSPEQDAVTSSTFFVPFSVPNQDASRANHNSPQGDSVEGSKLSKTYPSRQRTQYSRTAATRGYLYAGRDAPHVFLSYFVEVWGFEPQTYGLQSHRSSHLSYTPHWRSNRSGSSQSVQRGPRRLPTPATHSGAALGFATKGDKERAIGRNRVSRVTLESGCGHP